MCYNGSFNQTWEHHTLKDCVTLTPILLILLDFAFSSSSFQGYIYDTNQTASNVPRSRKVVARIYRFYLQVPNQKPWRKGDSNWPPQGLYAGFFEGWVGGSRGEQGFFLFLFSCFCFCFVFVFCFHREMVERMCRLYFQVPGLYFIKVKNILSLKFKNNLIFHFVKELKKNRFLNSFIK